MLRESSFLVRIKVTADVLALAFIVVATRFTEFQLNFFSQSAFVYTVTNVLCWLFIARAFGLYNDLRMKPISMEWIMFLKAFGIFTLLKSFIFFQVLEDFSFESYPFFLNSFLIFLLLPA
jgi:hypothetical protein